MRKTKKKIEAEIIRQLTEVCEEAKFEYEGFIWLTHEVDYRRFPESLIVTLVFTDRVSEEVMLSEFKQMTPKVQSALKSIIGGILPAKQIEARFEALLQ